MKAESFSGIVVGSLFLAAALTAARAEDAPAERPVERELKATAAGIEKQAPDAAKTFADGIAEVAKSGIVEKAPKVGDKAELFELPDASGKTVKLADLLAKGPVVLTWYRGGWCPYCNVALRGLVKAEPQLRELGATLVAVSPEVPDVAAETVKKLDLKFPVLTDKGNLVAKKYRIAFKVPERAASTMKAFKVDLEKTNGDASGELPLGVTYVIDTDRTIRWAFVDADYRKRAEPADVLAALKALKK
jgi:peroxiredoxin